MSRLSEVVFVSPGSWRLSVDDISLEVTGVVRDRGVIRVVLAILKNETVIYRDRVNLTSARARKHFLQIQTEQGIDLPERALLALDEAVRRPIRGSTEKGDGSPDISEKGSVSLAELERRLQGHLLLEDPDAFRVLLACVAGHRLSGDPAWLLIVGPSSGAKTELLSLFRDVPGIFFLSDLTEKTFASGLTTPGQGDPSLLARLNKQTLVLKDFTTVLSMSRDKRKEVLAQLREIYDGRFDKVWGTGKELHWQGRLGFVAGVTTVIDRHQGVISALGQRFVLLRLRQADRHAVAHRAMRNTQKKHRMVREELAKAVAAFFSSLSIVEPTVSDAHHETLARLADLVTRARSAVERDGYKRELDYTPEPEMPGRFARQLLSLAQGLALIDGRNETNDEDIRRVIRVGLDSIPDLRRAALEQLAEREDTIRGLTAKIPRYSETTVRRALEDLQTLCLVECAKDGSGGSQRWSLASECRDQFTGLLKTLAARTCTQESEPLETVEALAGTNAA